MKKGKTKERENCSQIYEKLEKKLRGKPILGTSDVQS